MTDALNKRRLFFTSKPNEISTTGPVIVTIGTPVDEFLNPERRVDTYTWRGVLKPYVLRVYYGVESKEGLGDERRVVPADLVRYETN